MRFDPGKDRRASDNHPHLVGKFIVEISVLGLLDDVRAEQLDVEMRRLAVLGNLYRRDRAHQALQAFRYAVGGAVGAA